MGAEKFCIHMNSEIYSQRSFVFIKKLHFYSLRSFVFIKKLQFCSLRSFEFIKKLHFYSPSIHKNLHIQCQIISQSTFLANSQYFPTLKPLVFLRSPVLLYYIKIIKKYLKKNKKQHKNNRF